MVQFYFLSILFNLVGGASLVLVSMPTRSAGIQGLKTFLRDPSVCLVTGILASVIGALKLLTAMRGDIPVVGLPGCVMYHKASIFDLTVPRLVAGQRLTREDIVELGHGGLCAMCPECRYPACGFGKG